MDQAARWQVTEHSLGYTSIFAIDEQYRRAYIPFVYAGQLRVVGLDSGSVGSWPLPGNNYGESVVLHESHDNVFVQSRFDGRIRQFRRSDGAVLHDYMTTPGASPALMAMTSNGRVVFTDVEFDGPDRIDYVGIIGASSIKAEDTPPVVQFLATPYSSHNFLFNADASRGRKG